MREKSKLSVLVSFVLLVAFAAGLSYVIVPMWGEKAETRAAEIELQVNTQMTITQIMQINNIDVQTINKAFKIDAQKASEKTLQELGISEEAAQSKLDKALALKKEEDSKNWLKIPLKLGLWALWLIFTYVMLKKNKITPTVRKYLLFGAVIIFGIVFGTEPNPMSTVKDNIVTLSSNGIIFPPRLVVMLLFLLTIFLANKIICAWGCQIGTLQDLIFRLNRDRKDTKGVLKQYKVPFAITNTIRILFFFVFVGVLLAWSLDIIEIINPFKIYNPAALTLTGAIFLTVIFTASLFIYRPWCHFFCPLGLIGWLVEKVSVNKIIVNTHTCASCEKCVDACPTNVMSAILNQDTIKPDCFSCATCINACPTKSVSFSRVHKVTKNKSLQA